MLTRFKVSGFKNLVDIDVRFGPFTCIAGANGVGKSNLFDAIKFLSDLAYRPLLDSAMSVRDENGRAADVRGLFRKYSDEKTGSVRQVETMTFTAEMIIPQEGVDDLGQTAKATATFLRYELELAYRRDNGLSSTGGLEILYEKLTHIKKGAAAEALPFDHKKAWRDSVVLNKRTVDFISTTDGGDKRVIQLHQDGKQGGSPIRRNAKTLPRTVLSATNAAENPTALLARNEMRSWRMLQLMPSSLRQPDEFSAPAKLGPDGSHLAATLYHLAQTEALDTENSNKSSVYGQLVLRLSELIEDVYAIEIDRDEKRELLTLILSEKTGTSYPARALSDGTLRLLALAVIELDPTAQGVLCLEEPENGIHPARIPTMLKLLTDIAVDPNEPVGPDNPLRQVIINTHSPAIVAQVLDSSLLVAERKSWGVVFSALPDTWRTEKGQTAIVARGKLLNYLNPLEFPENSQAILTTPRKKYTRVIDRPDLQPYFPHF